jgi:hypothetical protein
MTYVFGALADGPALTGVEGPAPSPFEGASAREGCATSATIVVSDMPAPPWMDVPASRRDVWIDVSQPAPNALGGDWSKQ